MSYYTTVQSAWDALYADCLSANSSIRFEQFILRDFNPGSVGDTFAKLFIQKAEEGVSVRLLLDIVGSYHLLRSSRLQDMRRAGVTIRFVSFQFMKLRDILDWTPHRNHRKLAIIDEDITYIGGVVFSDYVKSWNDFHARIEGAGDMFAKSFEFVWGRYNQKHSKYLQQKRRNIPISLIGNEHSNNILYKELCKRIAKAKTHVTVVTPYFSPGRKLRKLLVQAGKRGVVVSVVIPAQTDHVLAQMAHLSFISFSQNENIKLVASEKMNHAKIIQIDNWLTFGSSNFDRLSLFYNKELNIHTTDETIIADVNTVAIEPFFANTEPFAVVAKAYYKNPFVRMCFSVAGYFLRPFI